MYQPAALFIGLRYMRGRAADRFGRFVSWLSTIGITLGVMALVTVLSVMNGFERELQNNILGLMPQAILSAKQGSVNPQQLPEREAKLNGVTRVAPLTTGDYKGAENAIRNGVTTSKGVDVPGLHTRRQREANLFASGAGVEKQDQGAGVQRVHQQTYDHAVAGKRIRAQRVVQHLLQQGFEDHQWQAQLDDGAQVALGKAEGVAQNV